MSDFILTDKQRKRSNMKGTGIQYLPGHTDEFVDFCANIIRESKNDKMRILEIGGGGLRFVASILECDKIKRIYIVDPDYYALDHRKIFDLAKLDSNYSRLFKRKCSLFICNITEFLQLISTRMRFDYIISFRVFHFFSLRNFESIATKISNLLRNDGELFISGLSWRDNNLENEENILYANSVPIGGNKNYRKLDVTLPDVVEEKKRQNLRNRMLFFDCDFLDSIFKKNNLRRVGNEYVSSRVVNGYIYRKLEI